MSNILKNYLLLIRFDKPVGTILLLWPALWGLWVANQGTPDSDILVVFVLGVFLMRSAGCIINDIADRNIDGSVARTQTRPLVTVVAQDRLSLKQAVLFLVALCSIAFVLVLSLNNIKLIYHSFVALGLATVYPFCKRFFACPQFVLGLAFGYAIPMAYVASYESFNNITWLLYSLSIIHSIIYDSFYAMSDVADDSKLGLHSSIIWFNKLFGSSTVYFLGVLQLVFILILLLIAYLLEFKYYYIVVLLTSLLFYYQFRLAHTNAASNCLKAFRQNNWVGFVIYIGFLLEYYIK